MELEDIWNIDPQEQDAFDKILKDRKFLKSRSHGPLQNLKKNLAMNLGYAVIITLAYGWLIFYFPIWQVQLSLVIVSIFNIWLMEGGYRLYKSIDPTLSQGNVLETLKMHYEQFNAWFRQQMKVALFIYPVATAGGYMLGGAEGSGKPVAEFMSKPIVLIALVICLLVFVPASYYLAKWMNRKAFGKYVDQLKENIDALESPE